MIECEQQLKRWHAGDQVVRKLDEVSGIGLLATGDLTAAVGKPERFANGRQLSAWLGRTPCGFSSGDRLKLGSLSRQCSDCVCFIGPRLASGLAGGSRAARLVRRISWPSCSAGPTRRPFVLLLMKCPWPWCPTGSLPPGSSWAQRATHYWDISFPNPGISAAALVYPASFGLYSPGHSAVRAPGAKRSALNQSRGS